MPVSGEPDHSGNSLSHILSSKTPLLNLKLYIVVAIFVFCVLISLTMFLCIRLGRSSWKRKVKHSSGLIPLVSKEIVEIKSVNQKVDSFPDDCKTESEDPKKGEGASDDSLRSSDVSVEVQNIGWGRWYGLKELEEATRGFAEELVIGEGGYGVVYRGILQDGSVVAVKNLLSNKFVNNEFN